MDKCFEVLNGQSEHIKFTRESPNGSWLSFLNIQKPPQSFPSIYETILLWNLG
ncbi:hypothetical protein KIN20_003007 [Parelaphostrongylus tenuis]|uniref:Uncharacterized protein n=1 Tax=Parelaphostrongylus tenuis TaxID=148309 RepID=A0AAD5MF09_PARTN|nr:hypothetical protein KIN20_003007 [Parelaphostrongylus tenuis]